jgi:hypothetical protein
VVGESQHSALSKEAVSTHGTPGAGFSIHGKPGQVSARESASATASLNFLSVRD